MTAVVARFYVQSAQTYEGSTANHVQLGAVCRGAHNKEWSSATPAGQISMHIRNDAAFEQFEQGAEYEVTFRKVTKPAPGDGHAPEPYLAYGTWQCAACGQMAEGQSPFASAHPVPVEELDWSKHVEFYGGK